MVNEACKQFKSAFFSSNKFGELKLPDTVKMANVYYTSSNCPISISDKKYVNSLLQTCNLQIDHPSMLIKYILYMLLFAYAPAISHAICNSVVASKVCSEFKFGSKTSCASINAELQCYKRSGCNGSNDCPVVRTSLISRARSSGLEGCLVESC